MLLAAPAQARQIGGAVVRNPALWGPDLFSPSHFIQSKINPLSTFGAGLKGTFWRDPATVMTLGLTTDQQQRMDEIFRQHRINLIDLNAAVEKEELILEPLVEALPGG
jgi:hypothetical protein